MIALARNALSSSFSWIRSTRPVLLLLVLAGFCSCCFGQLPADLVLPSETLDSGSLVFQASNSITNSASLLVQNPASVTLSAGSYIRLEPGFDAVAGSTFHAVIDPNVVNWQPIPVPDPPTACTDCGLNFVDSSSDLNPQAVFAPNSSNSSGSGSGNIGYAVCLDETETYVVPCNISLSTTTYPNTNGHYHNNPAPLVSTISPASGYTGNYPNYAMPITLATTRVGQIENLFVADLDTGLGTSYDYAVGYLNFVYIDNSNIFYQTGGNTTNHGNNTWNHYMTVNAATGLQSAATFYINQYNPGQKVCINDMALPIGGKFDLKDNWQSPHISHDDGTAADVAAVAGSCPANYTVNLNSFRLACINQGNSLAANTITEGNHVHCRWPN